MSAGIAAGRQVSAQNEHDPVTGSHRPALGGMPRDDPMYALARCAHRDNHTIRMEPRAVGSVPQAVPDAHTPPGC